jgi:exonuclease SbcD
LLALEDPALKYKTWVEVQVETETAILDLDQQLAQIQAEKPFIERFFPRQNRTRQHKTLDAFQEELALKDLTPKAVFVKRCESKVAEQEFPELMKTFEEALELMGQKAE